MKQNRYPLWILLFLLVACQRSEDVLSFDVIIVGSGTGAVAAAVQASDAATKTALIHPLEWYGGMLTAGGVSATDGNHFLPAGLWGRFRRALYDHYGGPDSVATGWVSLTQFEPHVGARIFADWLAEASSLSAYQGARWTDVRRVDDHWVVEVITGDGQQQTLRAPILIDGTDLGDVAAAAGASFSVGMDTRSTTGEPWAPVQGNNIIQDLTYVSIVQDYGQGQAELLPEPDDYSPEEFACVCQHDCPDTTVADCETMLNYARLPNGKYMLNWPNFGNDYYLNPVPLSMEERETAYEAAKQQTLRFIYYLQNELGFDHLGIADDEFPTEDGLALYPYHREGRRIDGLVQFTLNHLKDPYTTRPALYQTGIAVGDYPVDHHHDKNPDAPELSFPPVPSFTIPAGSLVARDVPGILMADKAISVTNLANGSTRLQPVILQVGQVAGLMGAMAARQGVEPRELSVRAIQQAVLDAGGYLQPFFDVEPDDPDFAVLHRIGSTGLLIGTPEPYKWANRTWFYPDSVLLDTELIAGLQRMDISLAKEASGQPVTRREARDWLRTIAGVSSLSADGVTDISAWRAGLAELGDAFAKWETAPEQPVTRREWARLLDHFWDPFAIAVGWDGRIAAHQ